MKSDIGHCHRYEQPFRSLSRDTSSAIVVDTLRSMLSNRARTFAKFSRIDESGKMPKEKTRPSRRSMTAEHKAALAKGREEGLAVRRYLEALESSRPKRGRKRTPASIDRKLAAIDNQLNGADPLSRLHLLQEKKDLEEERIRAGDVHDL